MAGIEPGTEAVPQDMLLPHLSGLIGIRPELADSLIENCTFRNSKRLVNHESLVTYFSGLSEKERDEIKYAPYRFHPARDKRHAFSKWLEASEFDEADYSELFELLPRFCKIGDSKADILVFHILEISNLPRRTFIANLNVGCLKTISKIKRLTNRPIDSLLAKVMSSPYRPTSRQIKFFLRKRDTPRRDYLVEHFVEERYR